MLDLLGDGVDDATYQRLFAGDKGKEALKVALDVRKFCTVLVASAWPSSDSWMVTGWALSNCAMRVVAGL